MKKQLSRRPAAFKLSIADAYFLEELRATLSYAEAAQWLAEHVKAPGRSGRSSCSASPLCSPRRPHSLPLSMHDAPLPRDVSAESVEAYMSKLSLELVADRGLLYTDAAHMVLDMLPRSPQKAVDIEEGLCRGGKKQKWSSGFQVQDGCESPRPREAVDTAARRAQPKLSSNWEASMEGDDDRVLESRPREAVDAAAGRAQPKVSPCWKAPLGWKLRPSSEHSRSCPVMTIVGAHGFQHQRPRLPRTRSN
jgi:hypothetical protein